MNRGKINIIAILCFYIFQILMGLSYIVNSSLFGKSIVGQWGCVAVLMALIGLIYVVATKGEKKMGYKVITFVFLLLHIPATVCWAHFVGKSIAGTSGINGLIVHIVYMVFGVVCILLLCDLKSMQVLRGKR